MRPETWLESVFATPLQVRLLRLLMRDPKKYWTEREAARALDSPPPSARKVFRRLEALGMLEVRQAGRAHLVRPREQLALNDRIRAIFQTESSTLQEVWQSVRQSLPANTSCYVFGSTARGSAQADSDIDLLVSAPEAPDTQRAADHVRRTIRAFLPVPLNVVALARTDLRKPRYRALTKNILAEGRRLAGPDLNRVLG